MRRVYRGSAAVRIDGRAAATVAVTIEFGGERPIFMIASTGSGPGELLWIAADDDDATVVFDPAGGRLTADTDHRHAPAAPPTWFAPAGGPLGNMALPQGADRAHAVLTVSATGLTGSLTMSGTRFDGTPTHCAAEVTAVAGTGRR
ncbi:hypothetical protein [Thermomonospora curvata]|uniref:Uncharacterized protein n=1 Tax=Thermomonospora curvata (strain ATCC 19995 / DSM 43183 / JCM 3096 / KCTC 9072 / NBRC 15933 / NCIMB 10081 / Henssen B9) TaxID=471852 RepID=D1A8Q1_THECD|nr:hypothetical protein [Thermomonospora curvata]ACY96746.1 hypothetical protein Tcur_1163 [Thermomonospora curvata DSM 43183]